MKATIFLVRLMIVWIVMFVLTFLSALSYYGYMEGTDTALMFPGYVLFHVVCAPAFLLRLFMDVHFSVFWWIVNSLLSASFYYGAYCMLVQLIRKIRINPNRQL